MSDISQQIDNILSDPQMMERIKALGGLFGQPASAPEPPAETPPQSAQNADIIPSIMRFMPLLTSLGDDDDSTRLLKAIMPFLSPERRERMERAIKLLRVIRLLPLLRDGGFMDIF